MEPDRRIVTIPNVISVVRLLCAPVFVWLLADDEGIAAAIVLGVLGASDWVDGWIASALRPGQRPRKGARSRRRPGPPAGRGDRALLIDGSVPIVVGVLVLLREAVVSAAVLVLAMAGARRIDVQWAGKAGTLSVMFALPLFLLADNITSGHDAVLAAAWFFAIVGLALGYYAAITYLPMARAALREGRARQPVTESAVS